MEHDNKRPRLDHWTSGPPPHSHHGVSLPHPHQAHSSVAQSSLPSPQYPPPPSSHPHYPPRPADRSPAPLSQHPPPQPHPPPPPSARDLPPRSPTRSQPPQLYSDPRHHDSDRSFAPSLSHMQEPSPTRHSPTPNPYSPSRYAPVRDPLRRDPDESPHHQRRPLPSGPGDRASAGLPPPNHVGHAQHPDDLRRMNYDGPPGPAHTQGGFRPSTFPSPYAPQPPPAPAPPPHAQHPGSPTPPHGYDQAQAAALAQGYGPPGALPPPPGPGPQHPAAGQHPQAAEFFRDYNAIARRKATRASQACDSCRQLKAKCDELKPCKSCKEKGLECKYRDPVPKAQDKMTSDIFEGIQALLHESRTTRQATEKSINSINKRLSRLESSLARLGAFPEPDEREGSRRPRPESDERRDRMVPAGRPDDRQRPLAVDTRMQDVRSEAPAPPPPPPPPPPMHSHVAEAEDLTREDILEHEDQQVLHKLEVQQDMDAEAGPIVPPGEPSIPYNHTTSAANLLEWPGTRKMVSYLDEDVQKYLSQFPLRQEERRGVLRLYGRGEGRDTVESPPADQVDESGVVSDLTDDSSDVLASSPGDVWGVLGANSPPTVSGQDRAGVTGPSDGTVDYSDHVIWKYVESFQKNIMEMHPIIHHAELRALVRDFQRSLIPRTKTGSTVAKFATGADVAADLTSTGQKRKRSPTLGPVDGQEVPPTPRFQRPARTMRTALVLLVLALGKLSLHKEKLPYVSEHPIRESFKRNGRPASPMHMGSSPPPHVSPRDGGHPERPGTGSRRSSLHGAGSGIKAQVRSRKNTELIPGLEYFALATDIIGNQLGGTSLKHVIALILAGLFHGQIGRVVESHRYIHMASVIILTIMRPSLDRLRRMFHENEAPASHRDNNHLFAFWTCLQLESDITAELPGLRQSAILSYQADMPYPNPGLAIEAGHEERVVSGYIAQLYARKQLNQMHSVLYKPNVPVNENVLDALSQTLDTKKWLPDQFRFDPENDKPANNLLEARLRAKFWGAQVIIHRPIIRKVLEMPLNEVPNYLNETRVTWIKKAIRGLVESTRAFHGLGMGRLIVTNIFGTATAQWGNFIVLALCMEHEILSQWVDKTECEHLLRRTLIFFDNIAHSSSTLWDQKCMLEGIAGDLFGISKEEIREFCAQANAPPPTPTSGTAAQAPMLPVSGPLVSPPVRGGGGAPPLPHLQTQMGGRQASPYASSVATPVAHPPPGSSAYPPASSPSAPPGFLGSFSSTSSSVPPSTLTHHSPTPPLQQQQPPPDHVIGSPAMPRGGFKLEQP